jgi:hypothetical protein
VGWVRGGQGSEVTISAVLSGVEEDVINLIKWWMIKSKEELVRHWGAQFQMKRGFYWRYGGGM